MQFISMSSYLSFKLDYMICLSCLSELIFLQRYIHIYFLISQNDNIIRSMKISKKVTL